MHFALKLFWVDNFELRALYYGWRLRRFRIGSGQRARSDKATWTSLRRVEITNKLLGAQEAGSRLPNASQPASQPAHILADTQILKRVNAPLYELRYRYMRARVRARAPSMAFFFLQRALM